MERQIVKKITDEEFQKRMEEYRERTKRYHEFMSKNVSRETKDFSRVQFKKIEVEGPSRACL